MESDNVAADALVLLAALEPQGGGGPWAHTRQPHV